VSPLARALMNKRMGDFIVAGSGEAEIVAIRLTRTVAGRCH
jgi:transcription elongation GreA/GreB family factor